MNTSIESTSGATTLANRRKGKLWPKILVGCIFLLLVSFTYLQFTKVSGLELNTGNWRIRSFSFRQDPFTKTQLTGVKYASSSWLISWTSNSKSPGYSQVDPAIGRYLKDDANFRWDLVDIEQTPSTGEAKILVDLLGATDFTFQEFWPTWTVNHPQKASVFWPAAQLLVRFRQYIKLPDLFRIAVEQQASDEFEASIKSYVTETLSQHSQQLANSGQSADVDAIRSALEDFRALKPSVPDPSANSDLDAAAELSDDSQFNDDEDKEEDPEDN